jgi:ABC-type nitrate/sulfonate/bicarbonate transport system permease component
VSVLSSPRPTATRGVLGSALGRLRNWGLSLVVTVVLVVLWWFLSKSNTSPFYPPLSDIASTFRHTWLFADVGSEVAPSLERFALGYLLGCALGVFFGVLFGRVSRLYQAFAPAVQFARSIPATGLVPVMITVLGLGNAPKIYLIAFVCMFPILLNTMDGVRSIEPGLEDVARTFRLTRRQRIFGIQLYSAAPQIFSGMRIALSIAFIMMIISEMVGATNGIGFITLNAQQSFQVPLMWSGMILLAILGAFFNFLFLLIERQVLRWHYQQTGRAE